MVDQQLCFSQLHIDVARNSTDDFNPFHDPQRWQNIRANPYGSPIALGFQMEFLAADRVARHRRNVDEQKLIDQHDLHFSNFEFLFVDALRAGEHFDLAVKKTIIRSHPENGVSNRVVLRKSGGRPVLMGTVSETAQPRYLPDIDLSALPSLEHLGDRNWVPGMPYFLKRKYLNTSNGKNFAVGALCNQHDYFDELREYVSFAPLFTASLLSSALLEKGRVAGFAFEADPLVYTGHQISVDKRIQEKLRSNDMLHILVDGPTPVSAAKGLGKSAVEQEQYHCLGLVHGRQIVFRANVQLAPLHAVLASN